MKYKLNDNVWIIPYPSIPFAILCKILEVDIQYNNYWIDEPIGHGVQDDELTKSKNIILNEIKYLAQSNHTIMTLNEFRTQQKTFISNTWTRNNVKHPGFPKYTNKKHGYHWLNIQNLKKHKQ